MKLEDYMLPCLNKEIFGIDCPGCGFQRSIVLVLDGKFEEAFYMFPAIYSTLLFFCIVLLHLYLKKKTTGKLIIITAIINIGIMAIAYYLKLHKFIT